jgi:hypothetical protein
VSEQDATLPAAPPPERPSTSSSSKDWRRALGLFAVAFGLSVVRPSVLIGVPFIALLIALPNPRLPALMLGLLAALLAFGGGPGEGLWYAERAWAVLLGGWFAALTLRWPTAKLFPRAAGAVAGASVVVAAVLLVGQGTWSVLDRLVEERIRGGVGAGIEAMQMMRGEQNPMSPALLETLQRAMEFQAQVFPALLGLSSIAALGVAWWVHRRMTNATGPALEPVGDFRFNDQLVWVFITGLVLLLVGWGEALGWAGSNTLVFMSALYALRGAAVVLSVSGGLSLFGGMMLGMSMLFIAPVIFALALVIGLGDTWVDIRDRLRRRPA